MQSSITLTDKSALNILGVTKVSSVSPSEISLELNGEGLIVTGANMEVLTLDVENKMLNVSGTINSIKFISPKVPLLKRIFK